MAGGLRKFLRSPGAQLGVVIMILAVTSALFASQFAVQNPFDLAALSIADSQLPPGSVSIGGMSYWLGTDDQGRDVYSAILYGLRISLAVACVSTLIAFTLGTAVGLIAAHFGGWQDALLMRLADMQLAFPGLLIALVLLAVLGSGLDKVVLAIVAVQWAYYARTARSAALIERSKEYILAARNLRFSALRIVLIHLLPNSFAALSVVMVVQMASTIALEATLSFLGSDCRLPAVAGTADRERLFHAQRRVLAQLYPSRSPDRAGRHNLVGERLRALNDPRGLS